jgi:hypothetical protein
LQKGGELMRCSVLSRLICLTLSVACGSAFAVVKLAVTPRSVNLLSSKNAKWDTVEVVTYVYNAGDTVFHNTGTTPLLYADVRLDTASIAKHYLKPGDSLNIFAGFMLKDTATVLKTAFAAVAWTDPLKSFGDKPAVEDLRVSSLYVNLHPKKDTVSLAGCPLPTGAEKPLVTPMAKQGIVPSTVFDIVGRPVWSGSARAGSVPGIALPEGVYLLVQGADSRIFRISTRK